MLHSGSCSKLDQPINDIVHNRYHCDEGTLPFLVTEGVNVSVVMFPSCSSSRLHTFTPSAAPAAMAAPSAVVSGIDGLTTRTKGRKNGHLKIRMRSH